MQTSSTQTLRQRILSFLKIVGQNTKCIILENILSITTLYLMLFSTLIIHLLVHVPTRPKLDAKTPSTTPFQHDNIFWFIHISDIHLSDSFPSIYTRFDKFLNTSVPTINPSFVVCSGDITHGRVDESFPQHTGQQEKEWKFYSNALQKYNFNDPKFWIDTRGNHDDFGVPFPRSDRNLYAEYSPRAQTESLFETVYTHVHKTKFSSYSFIIHDQNTEPGFESPFNTYAVPNFADQSKDLQNALNTARSTSEITVMVGHYPTCQMQSRNEFISLISGTAAVYLTGHYHLRDMYQRIDQFLELEVADFKEKSVYRVLAIDNDMISFVDTELDQWPVILITNPKNSKFLSPLEKWENSAKSEEIRVLVFSMASIESVELFIDGQSKGVMQKSQSISSLYTLPWKPSEYSGTHTIQVIATDSTKNRNEISHSFNLEGQTERTSIHTALHHLQHTNTTTVFIFVFSCIYVYVFIFLLVIPKLYMLVCKFSPARYEMIRFKAQDFVHYVMYPQSDYMRQLDININFGLAEDIELKDTDDSNTESVSRTDSTITKASRFRTWLGKQANNIKMALVMHLWSYMHVSMYHTLVHLFFGVYLLFGPLIVAPLLAENWAWMFLWGFEINGAFTPQVSSSMPAALVIIMFTWVPSVVLSAIPYGPRVIHYQALQQVENVGDDIKPIPSRMNARAVFKYLWTIIRCLSYTGINMTLVIFTGLLILWVFFGKLFGFAGLIASPGVFWIALFSLIGIGVTYRGIIVQLRPVKAVL